MDSSEGFDYQEIVREALRDAVRRVLAEVAERGLPGEHFFYIGFRTDAPGVEIPRGLRDKYRDKMTVILQNQYWGLEVGAESFSVSLAFNGARQRLTIPFAALTEFVDPSAEFGLRFDGETETEEPAAAGGAKAAKGREKAVRRPSGQPFRESSGRPFEKHAARDPSPGDSTKEAPDASQPATEKGGAVVPFDPSRRR